MTNTIYALLYGGLSLYEVIILIIILLKRKRSRLDGILVFLFLMIFCWLTCETLYYLAPDPLVARLMYDLKLPFVALTALGIFLYIIRFYGLDSYFPPAIIGVLLAVPALTTLLSVTTLWHPYLRAEFIFLATSPEYLVTVVRGPWFWYHSVYCYLLILIALPLALAQHRRLRREYRRPSLLMLSGIAVSLLCNIFVLRFNTKLDMSLIGAFLSSLILYYSMRNYEDLGFYIKARQEAFHYLDEALFITDENYRLVNHNRRAGRWLQANGLTVSSDFTAIRAQLAAKAAKQEPPDEREPESGTDYYLADGQICCLKERPVHDRQDRVLGYFIFAADETQNRRLIARLDEASGLDALTGLLNRRKVLREIRRMEIRGQFPVGIIVGDVNGLKQTNDVYGHEQGDVLLRAVADALKRICPPKAEIARMGGDEFMIVVPQARAERLEQLIGQLQAYLAQQDEKYRFELSMALGFALRSEAAEPLEEVIRRADAQMYAAKKAMKAAARLTPPL